jgi:transposase-like protein
LKRAYAKQGTGHKRKPSERRAARSNSATEIQLPLDREELLGLMPDFLEGLAVELGLLVASAILEDEVTRLEDLVGRGPDTGRPTLFVLDGSKALHAAVTRVWGKDAVVQRCQVHERRNVKAHVPERHHAELERRLSEAYHETDNANAKTLLEGTARWLDRLSPDAASSLREGLDETLTVVTLSVPGVLRRTLTATSPIESTLTVTHRVTARVTRWRDGDVRRRWCVAGLLRAESKFRRVKGHQPTLLKAPESLVREGGSGNGREVA